MSTAVTPGYLAAAITGSWNGSLQAGATIHRAPIRSLELPIIPLVKQSAVERAQTAVSGLREQSELLNSQARQERRAIVDELRYSVPLEASDSVETATPNLGEKVKTAQVPERNVRPQPGKK